MLRSRNNLGFLLMEQEKYGEAVVLFQDALPLFEELRNHEPHPEVAGCMTNLGRCRMELGDLDEALRLLEDAVTMKREVFGDEDSSLAVGLHYLGDVQFRRGEYDDAAATLTEAHSMRLRLKGEGNRRTAESGSLLAECLMKLDRLDEAETLLLAAYPVIASSDGAAASAARRTLELLVDLYERKGNAAEAAKYRALRDS